MSLIRINVAEAYPSQKRLNRMKITISIICGLLTLLWAYAAFSKLLSYHDFLIQLKRQPLPTWSISGLAVGLPIFELLIAFLLCGNYTKKAGLWLSSVLMICFTGYVALALSGAFGSIPCSCGGILSRMGWQTHLIFNIVYTILALFGLWTFNRYKKLNIHAR
jgi:hypothetical protein